MLRHGVALNPSHESGFVSRQASAICGAALALAPHREVEDASARAVGEVELDAGLVEPHLQDALPARRP